MIYLENESKWPGRICFHLVNPSIQCILQKNESFVIQAVRNIERWVEQQLIWALECILYRYTVHVKDIILLLNIILLCNTGAPRAQRWGEGGGVGAKRANPLLQLSAPPSPFAIWNLHPRLSRKHNVFGCRNCVLLFMCYTFWLTYLHFSWVVCLERRGKSCHSSIFEQVVELHTSLGLVTHCHHSCLLFPRMQQLNLAKNNIII